MEAKSFKKLRILIILIIACLTLPLFFSCGGDSPEVVADETPQNYNGGTDADADVGTGYISREETPDSLPDGLNFNGTDIRILHRSENSMFWRDEIAVEELTGEIVNDAIFHRNRTVEERLNVEITSIAIPGDWSNRENFMRTVRTSVTAGSDDYDIIAGYAWYMPILATEGLFYNLHNVPYLEPRAPWWSADCAEQMTIDGRLFFITGDLSNSLLRGMKVTFFNQQLAENFALGNLYQIVLNGEFTIDKLSELIRGTYMNLNGTGIPDRYDLFGFGTPTGNQMNGWPAAFNQPIVTKDSFGIPQIAFNTPRMMEIVNVMYEFFYHNENVFIVPEDAGGTIRDMFVGDRLLFKGGILNTAEGMRAMESDFGILPMPKWSADQPGYFTISTDWYSLFCIPVTSSRIDAVGATMEALAAESYRRVTPAYFEVALKQKYSRDEETSQMLDIIREGLRFDFGTVNTANLDGIHAVFRTLMDTGSNAFASFFEANEARFQTALDRLIDTFHNMN